MTPLRFPAVTAMLNSYLPVQRIGQTSIAAESRVGIGRYG